MAASDARPIPRKNTAFRVTFPIFDADGDLVSGATGLDSEYSGDGGAFADCTNEATEIAASSGMYYLDLTAGEMNYDTVAVIVKTGTSGAKTTPIVLYPEEAGDMRVDVVQISGDATAADNAELMFDGTGYAGGTARLNVNTDTLTAGAITAAAIADNAIDAGAIAADAITAAKVAADVSAEIADQVWDEARAGHVGAGSFGQGVASVQGNVTGSVGSVTGAVGSVTGAVGSVTGNVGGNVAGSVASVTNPVTVGTNSDKTGYSLSAAGVQAVWDALTAALTTVGSIGKRIADFLDAAVSSRLATAGYTAPDNATITAINAKTTNLPASPAAVGSAMTLAAGSITAAVIATGAIDADAIADNAIDAAAIADGAIDAATFAAGAINAAAIATGAIDADALATDAVAEIADGVWDEALAGHATAGSAGKALSDAGAGSSTPAAIADAVWDEAIGGHLGAGSTGAALNAAGSSGDPWTTPLPGAYGAGTAGKIIGDNLDAAISSRLATAGYTTPPTVVQIRQEMDSNSADLNTIIGYVDELESRLTAIRAGLLDNLTNLDTTVSSRLATAGYTVPPTAVAIRQEMDSNSVDLNSILAYVDDLETRLTAVRAGYLDNLTRLDVVVSTRLASASYTTPPTVTQIRQEMDTNSTDLNTIIAAVDDLEGRLTAVRAGLLDNLDATVSSRLPTAGYTAPDNANIAAIKAKTDNLPAAPAAVGNIPTAAAIADQVWDEAIAGHVGAGSTGEALSNAGGGSSPAAIADAVWDELLAGHAIAGSAGAALAAAGGSGGGSVEFIYTVTNSITTLPIEGVTVWVTTDLVGANIIASGHTDAFGRVTFFLDPGTYYFWRSMSGYGFANPDVEVVT